jgi:S-adenosylmethionine:tRNA ribosyltransferase-isomerase
MLSDFDFELPNDLIAQHPLPRGKSRVICNDNQGNLQEIIFEDIHKFFNPGDVVVLNNTKVIPSFLSGNVNDSDITVNLINRCIGTSNETWEVLSKPRKKLTLNSIVKFSDTLSGKVIEKYNSNDMDVIEFNLSSEGFYNEIDLIGSMPLPQYIKRPTSLTDATTYQTVFSKVKGSVAAPTAGLHFTTDLLEILKNKGVNIAYITLHVGSGTFLPVRTEKIADHKMHTEFYNIDQNTCNIINEAKSKQKKIIAIGTTSLRALESSANFCNEIKKLAPHSNYTNLFVTVGYKFKIVDSLVTNFHLPKSTLFMLVCGFLGSVDNGQRLYKHAIQNKYRFFSYGDACFIERK